MIQVVNGITKALLESQAEAQAEGGSTSSSVLEESRGSEEVELPVALAA